MAGSRFIYNARYFHVAKSGEKAGKHSLLKEAAAGMVAYIATRESVVFNTFTPEYEIAKATMVQRMKINELVFDNPKIRDINEYRDFEENLTAANATRLITRAVKIASGIDTGEESSGNPEATNKQIQRIEGFINRVPELKETHEYQDYLNSPTFANASEFLSNSFENSFGSNVDSETLKTMVQYIATRPGVVTSEKHGLFSWDNNTDLQAYMDEVSNHSGNIYTNVFSLRREDADRLGFDTQEPWKDVVYSKIDKIAENAKIPLSELRWCAAMHNTGHHPHIHLFFWSKNPTSRNFLTQKGIENIKSAFAHEIFQDDFSQYYTQQRELVADIKEQTTDVLNELGKKINEYSSDDSLNKKFSTLAMELQNCKGKHVYKLLPKEIKAMTNSIIDELEKIPEISKLHEMYENETGNIYKVYKGEYVPKRMSEAGANDNLYALKNMVIKAADSVFDISPNSVQSETDFIQGMDLPETDMEHETKSDLSLMINQLQLDYADGDAEAAIKLGEIYDMGLYGVDEDIDTAVMWYGIAANSYQEDLPPLVAYRLSEIIEDKNLSGEYAAQAAYGLIDELKTSPNSGIIEDLFQGKYNYEDIESYHYNKFIENNLTETEFKSPAIYRESAEDANKIFLLAKLFLDDHTYDSPILDNMTIGIKQDDSKAKSLLMLAFDVGYPPLAQQSKLTANLENKLTPTFNKVETEKSTDKSRAFATQAKREGLTDKDFHKSRPSAPYVSHWEIINCKKMKK